MKIKTKKLLRFNKRIKNDKKNLKSKKKIQNKNYVFGIFDD